MTQSARFLKAIVIVLGVLIVAAGAVLVSELVRRMGGGSEVATAPPAGDFADASVALPPGARVLAMTGNGNVLSLLVEAGNKGQIIVAVDRRDGTILGTITLAPAPNEGE